MGKKKPKQTLRNILLAKIHIGKKDLGLDDMTYRELLEREFGVASAADLNVSQMKDILSIYRSWGWDSETDSQVLALRERARKMAEKLPDGEKRLNGLVKRICGVNRLDWCRNVEALQGLLAALGKIQRNPAYLKGPKKGKNDGLEKRAEI